MSQNSLALQPKPFNADYKMYRGDKHVANARFSLQENNGVWRWILKSQARGLYKWLTSKQPYSETRMINTPERLQLSQHRSGDHPKQPATEKTWFDQQKKIIFYDKNNISKQLKLPEETYNYHSIHLLYPDMLKNGVSNRQIQFYKKGKLLKSRLTLERQFTITHDNTPITVDKLTQQFDGSKQTIIYYYQDGTLAPLKIEQIKPGKETRTMWRINVE